MSIESVIENSCPDKEVSEKSADQLSFTELKAAYRELLKREALLNEALLTEQKLLNRYKSIIEHSPNAFFITTADGKILDANKSATKIFGYGLADLQRIGRQGIIDHNEPAIYSHLKTREQSGKVHGEVTGVHKSGERFPCVFLSFIFPDGDNGGQQNATFVEEVYEKQVTAEDLANTEKRFQQLIENGDDVIIEIDKDRIIKYVSPSVKRIMGYEPSEVIGHRLREFAWHEDAELLADIFQQLLHNPGKTFYEQYRIKHKTKEFIWVEGSAISLFDVHGIESLIINQRDISVKKQALELITVSENRYRYLFNCNPFPLFIFDTNTLKILECNEACVQKYGYSREEFLNLTFKDLPRKEDVALLSREFEMGSVFLDNYKKTWRHCKKNGDLIYVKITANKIQFRGTEAVLVLANDITENVFAHNLLKQSFARLQVAEQIAHLGYWELNMATAKLYWSKEVYKIFGIEETGFGGDRNSFFERIHPDDRQAFLIAEELALKSKTELIFEHRIVRPDGTERSVLEKGSFTYNDQNKPIRFEGTVQDITDRKLHEQEREQLIGELTLTINDLQQFSYITSHNLRTPLSNLIGLLNLLEGIPIEDEMLAQIISGFKVSTLSLNETVNDLVKVLFVKKNASIQQEPILLKPLFEKVIMQTKSLMAEDVAEINYDFSTVPQITFNKAYLESILLNLLTNAIKYRSPLRALKVSVTAEYAGDKILLRFSDNGLGLDVEKHKLRIFGFYQRFHDHPDSKGIGLYLVKSQLEALGGSIEIQSEVNVGTQFTLSFKDLR